MMWQLYSEGSTNYPSGLWTSRTLYYGEKSADNLPWPVGALDGWEAESLVACLNKHGWTDEALQALWTKQLSHSKVSIFGTGDALFQLWMQLARGLIMVDGVKEDVLAWLALTD